ncbi:MAG: phage terminase small subunit P27 family [Porticoccaceae bacterium]
MSRKTPPHLRELSGNPSKRRISSRGVQPVGAAERPEHVTGYAAEVWDRIVTAMPGVFRITDETALAAYCTAADEFREATLHLATEGAVITGARGAKRTNPWLAVQRSAGAGMASLGRRLGLDPTSRDQLPPPPKPSTSKFAGLVADYPRSTNGESKNDY